MTGSQKSESPVAAGQVADQNTESMASVPPVHDGCNPNAGATPIARMAVARLRASTGSGSSGRVGESCGRPSAIAAAKSTGRQANFNGIDARRFLAQIGGAL